MSRIRSLAIKTPIHTILRIKEAERGRQNVIYRNQILTVVDSSGKPIDEVRVKNAISASTSVQKIVKQQFPPFIQQVIKGYNLLVMSLGTTGSGKETLFGGTKNRGLIATLIQQLCIDCQSPYYATNHQNLDFFFEIRAIEIFEERVMDLFNANLPTSCTMKDNVWDGVVLERSTSVKAENYLDFMEKLDQVYKNRQNILNLLSGSTAKTSSIITVSLFQEFKDKGKRATLCSKIMFVELPGLQILKNSQQDLRVRETNKAIRGLVSFSSLIKELSDDSNEISPLYEASNLTFALKEFLGSNSLCVTFANVINEDPDGTLKTLACMKNISKISQYPVVNTGQCLGLMYRIRTDLASLKVPQIRDRLSEKNIKQQRMMNENSNSDKIKAEDDYKRILEKYKDSKGRLQDAIRKKSQLQLLLIRSQQQKLQLSKTLVQVQIQNTKLMQQAQFKQYNMSKKNHKLESTLLKNEGQKTRSNQNINNMNQYLARLEEDKRDLEIEFIALKKNYLLSQKQLQESRKEAQTIQIDYINLANQNKYLQEQLFRGTKDEKQKYQVQQINKYHTEKSDWIQKQNQYKRQLQQIRRQLLKNSKTNSNAPIAISKASNKSSNNIQLQNQKLQLYNRLKLSQRKVNQLQQHLRILNQDIEQYKQQNTTLSQSLNTIAGYYKNKLQQLIRSKQGVGLNKAMNEHLASQNEENMRRVTQLGRKVEGLKEKNRRLRIHNIRLKGLAEQYMPRGLELPGAPEEDMDEAEQQQILRLNSRIRQLQNQLRTNKTPSNQQRPITNQMLHQQLHFLKSSRVATPASQSQQLRHQQNQLKQQNRKLTMMLKDSNKLEIAAIMKENENLRGEIERMRGKDSVSPVSNDQKLVYYEKHIKKMEKERSQLLVRVTMAEEQLKMYQNHYEKKR